MFASAHKVTLPSLPRNQRKMGSNLLLWGGSNLQGFVFPLKTRKDVCQHWEVSVPPTSLQTPWRSEVTQKWLKSDFQGLTPEWFQSDSKVTQKWVPGSLPWPSNPCFFDSLVFVVVRFSLSFCAFLLSFPGILRVWQQEKSFFRGIFAQGFSKDWGVKVLSLF